MDFPSTIRGWIRSYHEEQTRGFEWCDLHGKYWWEDGCAGCAAETEVAVSQQARDPHEPFNRFTPCPNPDCGKPIHYEDWPHCRHCGHGM